MSREIVITCDVCGKKTTLSEEALDEAQDSTISIAFETVAADNYVVGSVDVCSFDCLSEIGPKLKQDIETKMAEYSADDDAWDEEGDL